MKVLLIILKEIKHNIRNYKANAMMILFPIILIIILGAAFSGTFDSTIKLGEINVLYTIDENVNTADPMFEKAFNSFRDGMNKEHDIKFEETEDINVGMAGIENKQYDAYFHITGDPVRADMYKNESSGFKTGIVENAMGSFLDTYVTMSVIARNNPAALTAQQSPDSGGYVKISSIDRKRQPGSTDYYAITMLTLFLLYATLTGFWGVRSEIEEKTAARILCSPTTNYQLLAGKVLGGITVTILQALVVILFSGLILKADWGEDLFTVALLVISYSIMAVSIGVALAYMIRNGEAASGILNSVIPVLVFLGGGYVPLETMNANLSTIASISPVKWINSALLNVIYDGNYSSVAVSVCINLGMAVLFIVFSVVFSKRGNRAYA